MSLEVMMPIIIVLLICLTIFGFLVKGERFEMKQAATGKVISTKRGFSFTYLFFGPFVPLFRGHIAGFFLTLLITLCSCGLGHFILLFCYNGMYINWLANQGYVRMDIPQMGTPPVQVVIQNQSGEYKEVTGTASPEVMQEEHQEGGGILQKMQEALPLKELQSKVLQTKSFLQTDKTDIETEEKARRIYGLEASESDGPLTTKIKINEEDVGSSKRLLNTKDGNKEFWLAGAPVVLTGMQLFEDLETQEIFLGFGIQNMTQEPVTAVYLDVTGYNVLKKVIVTLKDVNYLDLSLVQGQVFSPKTLIALEDKTVRRCEVFLRHVVFRNEDIWDYEEAVMFPELLPQEILPFTGELLSTFKREIKACTKNPVSWYRYMPMEMEEGWYCGCGQFNLKENEDACIVCGMKKESIFSMTKENFLAEQNGIYQEEQRVMREKNERLRQEETERLRMEREEEELLQQQKIEERNQKIEQLQEAAKEKAKGVLTAATAYYGKGKEKLEELGSKTKEGVQTYLREEAAAKEVAPKEATPVALQETDSFCQACGAPINTSDLFCMRCGAKVEQQEEHPLVEPAESEPQNKGKPCPQCGETNEMDALFCIECGNPLRTDVDV